MNNNIKIEYFQRLPHIQPIGACYFVTFILQGSISKSNLIKLNVKYVNEKKEILQYHDIDVVRIELAALRMKYFERMESLLEGLSREKFYLESDDVARIMSIQIKRYDGIYYDLLSYCIMPNHVHMLIDTSIQVHNMDIDIDDLSHYVTLDKVMKKIKGTSARYANQILGIKGQFWARESYDVRIKNNKMLLETHNYILNNPVKAGLCTHPTDYKWSYDKSQST